MSLDRYFDGFKYKSLREFIVIHGLIDRNNISMSDFEVYVENKLTEMKSSISKRSEINKSYEYKYLKLSPTCPACSNKLQLIESREENFESEWNCSCGYTWFTDISVVDQQEILRAQVKDKQPDFPPEEIRASKEVRAKRRAICKICRQNNSISCNACGCRIKHRTYYKDLKCPKGKW